VKQQQTTMSRLASNIYFLDRNGSSTLWRDQIKKMAKMVDNHLNPKG